MNRKDRRGNKTTYLSGNTGIRLICEAVAVELLFYAMLAIFRSAFGWQLPIRALGKLQVAMLVSLVLFIVGVPATGKYQRVCKVVLEIGYPAALVLFGIFHRRKLTESGKMLFQAYLSYWNKQYGTNYMTGSRDGDAVYLYAGVFIGSCCAVKSDVSICDRCAAGFAASGYNSVVGCSSGQCQTGLEWNCTLFRGNRAGVCGTMDAHGCKGG